MRKKMRKNLFVVAIVLLCSSLLVYLTGCQGQAIPPQQNDEATTTPPQVSPSSVGLELPAKPLTSTSIATATLTPIMSPTVAPTPAPTLPASDTGRPVLAFYYTWYNMASWNKSTMSDLPVAQYNSSDSATIDQHLHWAAEAGISGFINSWWGADDQTDHNFVRLLERSAALENTTHYHFTSSIYFESDAPKLNSRAAITSALRYLIDQYGSNRYFFHWQGKPVIFFWHPINAERTLEQWAQIRKEVDPNNQTIWSAEGTDTNILSVFDGLHLFSAGYWGIQNNTMTEVDQGFRAKIDAYNQAHQTQKIWAAGVTPGFDDSRVPGRTDHVVVARNNGTTYTTGWQAAIASNSDWITVTSFNEWFEGSMIEPGMGYGNQYLSLTRQFSEQWRTKN